MIENMQVNEASKKEDGWSPTNYAKHASFVYSQAFTSPVLDLLDARPGEKILDLGCGSGELGIIIEKSVGTDGELKGVVVGVDQSVKMVLVFQFSRSSIVSIVKLNFYLNYHSPPLLSYLIIC